MNEERVVWIETSPTNDTITTNLSSSVYLSLEFFDAIFIPTVVVFGLIGNILSIFVFGTTKLSRLPSSSYLTALAVTDSISLINLLFVSIPGPSSPIHLPVLCNLIVYLINVCGMTSSWLVVVFTVERFIVIQYPLHKLAKCSAGKARRLILFVVPFPCVWFVYTFLIAGIDPDSQRCTVLMQFQIESTVLHTVDIFIVYLIPAFVVILLNVKIARVLVKCRRQRSNMQSGVDRDTRSSHNESVTKRSTVTSLKRFRFSRSESVVTSVNNVDSTTTTQSPTNICARSNDLAITRTLIVTSTAFAVLNFPHNCIQMIRSIVPLFGPLVVDDTFHILTVLSNDLYYFNFAVNVIVYHLTSSNYRKGAKRVLLGLFRWPCCKRNVHRALHRQSGRSTLKSCDQISSRIPNGDVTF